jgi:hypothetical protein
MFAGGPERARAVILSYVSPCGTVHGLESGGNLPLEEAMKEYDTCAALHGCHKKTNSLLGTFNGYCRVSRSGQYGRV